MNNNFREEQYALDYITFMMVAGNFKKANLSGQILSERLKMSYLALKDKTKDALMDRCATFADNILFKELGLRIWDEEVNVSFVMNHVNGHPEVFFTGDGFTLQVTSRYITPRKLEFVYLFTKECGGQVLIATDHYYTYKKPEAEDAAS